jgi:DNA-binding transcriptional ArsR family regulator
MNCDSEYALVIGVLIYENDANLVGDGRGPSFRIGSFAAWAAKKDAYGRCAWLYELEEIEREFDLSPAQAEYHLRMLEKALVVAETAGGWIATPTGILYLEKVETKH